MENHLSSEKMTSKEIETKPRKYKKILLLYPPFLMETAKDRSETYGSAILPPLGMLTLAGELEKNNYDVNFIDAELDLMTDKDIFKRVLEIKPDILGIYCTTANFRHLISLSKKIKETLNVVVFFGGPHVWNNWEEAVDTNVVDFTVIGEGEKTCVELLDALNKNRDLSVVKGLAYKKEGRRIFTGLRPFLENLDELSYAAFHLVDIKRYRPSPQHVRRTPSALMITTRGCPFNCTFCYVPLMFKKSFRTRSVDHVIGEIKLLTKEYGIKEIQFHDDLFGANKKWLEDFLDKLLGEKIDITWSCLMRIDTLDWALVSKMKKAGCWCIFFGMESLDQEVLDAIDKGITVGQIEKAIHLLKKAGIEIRANLILASPTETPEKAKRMIKKLCNLNPDYAKFNVMTPYPGTKLYEQVKEGQWGRFIDEYSEDKLTNHEVVFIPFGYKNTEEILKLRRYAYLKFYFRPRYIFSRMLKLRCKYDLTRYWRGFKLLTKRYWLKSDSSS